MTTQIQIRRDTTANWGSVDPVLADGEIGYDTTSSQFKVGNGVDSWSALSFSSGGASSWDELQGKPTDFPPSAHGHEEITKSEDGQPTAYIRYADDTWKASPGLEVEGDITVSGDATIGGGVEIDGDLSLGGKFEGDLTVNGNITIEGGQINAPDGGTYLTDAPSDGNQYARQDAAWSEVVAYDDTDIAGALAAALLRIEVLENAPPVDAYTKAESDGRYQVKGDYAVNGASYTKSESDGAYVPKTGSTTINGTLTAKDMVATG